MGSGDDGASREYVEAIEKRLQALRGRPLLLSPEDLERVVDWHERGVPLALINETLDAVFAAAASRRRAPRSLAYCAPAIEEAFEDLQENRVGRRRAQHAAGDAELPALIRELASGVRASGAPRAAAEAVALELEAAAAAESGVGIGQDLAAILDRRLCDACLAALDETERLRIVDESCAELAGYREKMTSDVFEGAVSQALRRRLRRRFELPDLTLLPLL